MPKYNVILEGENFPLTLVSDSTCLFGFITTRSVKADKVSDAERMALDIVNNDKNLWESLDDKVDIVPNISVTKVIELKWWNRLGGGGYNFFPMDEREA